MVPEAPTSERFCPSRWDLRTAAALVVLRSPNDEGGARDGWGGRFQLLDPLLTSVRKDPNDESAFALQHALPGGQHLSTSRGEGLTGRLRELAFELLKVAFLVGHSRGLLWAV